MTRHCTNSVFFLIYSCVSLLTIPHVDGKNIYSTYNDHSSYQQLGNYGNALNSPNAIWNRPQLSTQRSNIGTSAYSRNIQPSAYNYYNPYPRAWNGFKPQINNQRSYSNPLSPQGADYYNRRNGYGYYYPLQGYASPHQYTNPFYTWSTPYANGYASKWDNAFRRRGSRRQDTDGRYWKDGLSSTTHQPSTTETTSRQPKRKSKLFVANVWG